MVFGQSCALDTVTPKKVALRAEIFTHDLMEGLYEPNDEDQSDDDDANLVSKLHRRNLKVKQLSGSKKRQQFESN